MGEGFTSIELVKIFTIIVNFKIVFIPTEAFPLDPSIADKRMIKPPTFPYDPPYGYHSSGILCLFSDLPYVGGWAGRSCAGPLPPFVMPTPPSTTTTTTVATTTTTERFRPRPASSSSTAPAYYYPPMAAAGSSLSYSSYLPFPMTHPYYHNEEHNPNQYADYGDPIEGNPWEPDEDDIFIENYGYRAGRPGFRLGDPHRSD